MNDPTFENINRLFVLSFKIGDEDLTKHSFANYYMSLVEIKDFKGLTDNKPNYDQHIKDKQEAYEKLVEMSKNDDYATRNSLEILFHRKYIINSLAKIYQDKQKPIFCNKLISNEN